MNSKVFSFLPNKTSYKKEEIPTKIKESITRVNDDNHDLYEKILNQMYYRLTSDNPEYTWNLKDYVEFKTIYKDISIRLISVIGPSIIKCLKTPNSEIYNELLRFSQKVDWYPESDRVEDKNTHEYTRKLKEIKCMDAYFIIRKLTIQMVSSILNHVKKVSRVTDDLKPEIDYILENMTYEFYNIDEEFKYLEEFPLFYDIYLNMKERINKELIKALESESTKKNEIKNAPIRHYELNKQRSKSIEHHKFVKSIKEYKRK